MQHTLLIVSIVAAVIALASLSYIGIMLFEAHRARKPRGGRQALANIGEGVHDDGKITYRTDGAITTRYLLGKIGSDAAHIAVAGASDIAIGTITDEAAAAEDPVCVRMLGGSKGTRFAVASAAITAGDMLVSQTGGKVRTLPGSTGTYYIIGRAITAAAADGDIIEMDPSFPVQRVVA